MFQLEFVHAVFLFDGNVAREMPETVNPKTLIPKP